MFVVGDSNYFSSQEMSKNDGRWQEQFDHTDGPDGLSVSVRSLVFGIPRFMVRHSLHSRLIYSCCLSQLSVLGAYVASTSPQLVS